MKKHQRLRGRSRRWAALEDDDFGDMVPTIAIVKGEAPTISIGGSPSRRHRNHIYFYDDVTEEAAASFVVNLRETVGELKQVAAALEVEPPPIHVHINSFGGSVFAGFAMHDAIRECPLRVITHIEGSAASAATLLSVAGSHRTIGRNGFILIHQLSTWFEGTFEEQKDDLENSKRLMSAIKNIYKERTCIPARKLSDMLKRDLWLPADMALKYGLVDEIREEAE